MSKHLIGTFPVHAKRMSKQWKQGRVIKREAFWQDRKSSTEFFKNMPIKVKMANKVHSNYDHGGSDKPQWKTAWIRLQKHMPWFNFQTDWF